MLEAIAGDVMGSNYEYDPIKTKYFELLGADCFFTDDTVMTIAVADSLMERTGLCGNTADVGTEISRGWLRRLVQQMDL